MDNLRQVGTGILLAVISIVLILGGFTMAMAEGRASSSVAPTATFVLVIPPGLPTLSGDIPTETQTSLPQDTATPTLIPDILFITSTQNPNSPVYTATPLFQLVLSPTTIYYPATSTICTVPIGWISITVQSYDTLSSIALTYNMTQASILQGNCLVSSQLVVGQRLYVTPRATSTYAVVPTTCGAPAGWVTYYVVSGDNLYNIGTRYRVTVAQLQSANCLGSSIYILVGQALKVPNVATTAPLATNTTAPSAPTATHTPIPPTAVPPTAVPPTSVPPTAVPPTAVPPTSSVPPTATPFSLGGPVTNTPAP